MLPADLPTLIAVRGWSSEMDPGYLAFLETFRGAGYEVEDVFVPHDGFEDFGEWATASVETALSRQRSGEPLHLIGYCAGGTLLHVGLRAAQQRGISPSYLGFLDVRAGNPELRLRRGLDAMYQVPFAQRVRHQLNRLAPPDRETFGAVACSVIERSVRSVIELPKRGWRSRKLHMPLIQRQAEMAARWEFDSIDIPAYLYNCRASMDRYWPDDVSLGRAALLRGGFAIRLIDGDHHSCLQGQDGLDLIERIARDRHAVHSGMPPLAWTD